jgi:uncharacterized glyoxalase superfamily protein PhnB
MSVVTNTPILPYHNAEDAAAWLCDAYGFNIDRIARDGSGELNYISLKLGHNFVLVSPSSSPLLAEFLIQPDDERRRATQTCYVYVDDIDAHFARAKSAGAEIALNPEADEDGAKFYVSRDPDGHLWIFGTRRFVDARPAQMPVRSNWGAVGLATAVVMLFLSAAWLTAGSVRDQTSTIFSLSTGEQRQLARTVKDRIAAIQQKQAAAERRAQQEQDDRAAAERRLKEEAEKRLAAERLASEQKEKRSGLERRLSEEERKRAAAELLAAEAENKRIVIERLAAAEKDKRVAAERFAAEEKDKRIAAERIAQEEKKKRNSTDRLLKEVKVRRAAITRRTAEEQDKVAAAEQRAAEEAEKRADAERSLKLFSEQLARAKSEQERLRSVVDTIRRETTRDHSQLTLLRRRQSATLTALRSSMLVLHKQLTERTRALAELSQRYAAMQATLADTRKRLETVKATVVASARTLAQEREARGQFEEKLKLALKEVASLKSENARLENELARGKPALKVAAKETAANTPAAKPEPVKPADDSPVKVSSAPPIPEKNERPPVTEADKKETPEERKETAGNKWPGPAILDTKCKRVAWSRLFAKFHGEPEQRLKLTRMLCLRAEASDGPVRCIGLMMRSRLAGVSPSLMHPRLEIGRLISLCGGTHNPRKTVRCYYKRRAARQSVSVAIDRCQDYSTVN